MLTMCIYKVNYREITAINFVAKFSFCPFNISDIYFMFRREMHGYNLVEKKRKENKVGKIDRYIVVIYLTIQPCP